MPSAVTIKHETFELRGETPLFAQSWTPVAEVRGVVGIVHGIGEHSNRYAALAERLAQARLRVVAYDQRGHGRTGGKRGDARGIDVLLDDLEVLLRAMATPTASLPSFLLGQSFGGMLVLNFAIRRRPSLDGIIVSSPLLLPTHPPPAWKQMAARTLQRVWPAFTFHTGIQAEQLSHDPAAIAAYKSDPLVHDLVSARLAVAMLDAGQWTLEHAAELTTPTLLMHGLGDEITSPQAAIDFAQRAATRCTLRTFPGLYHELYWERERDEVLAGVWDWLEPSLRQ